MKDEAILTMFARKEEDAIVILQKEYGAYCQKIASAILSCPEDSEECLTDVWNQRWQTLTERRPEKLKAYLVALTRNAAKRRYDQMTAEKRGGTETSLVLEELSECIAGGETPVELLLGKALGDETNRFLKALPARQRDVFLRRYYFSDSTAEIARRFRLREDHMLVLLSRTRKKLRQHLPEADKQGSIKTQSWHCEAKQKPAVQPINGFSTGFCCKDGVKRTGFRSSTLDKAERMG